MPLNPARANYFTGTDMTILMGAVPASWGTPRRVIAEKLGLYIPEPPSIAMEVGTELEPYVRSKYLAKHPDAYQITDNVFECHEMFGLAGTADLIYKEPDPTQPNNKGIVKGAEFKTTNNDWSEVPLRVKIQCQVYMLVWGLQEWDLESLHGNHSLKSWTLQHDEELASKIIQTADKYKTEFWNRGILPEDEAATPVQLGATINNLDEEAAREAQEYMLLKSINEENKARMEALEESLRRKMSNNKKAKAGQFVLTQNQVRGRKKVDWESMVRWFEIKFPNDYHALENANTSYGQPYWTFSVKEDR